jgi:hypothetical protein
MSAENHRSKQINANDQAQTTISGIVAKAEVGSFSDGYWVFGVAKRANKASNNWRSLAAAGTSRIVASNRVFQKPVVIGFALFVQQKPRKTTDAGCKKCRRLLGLRQCATCEKSTDEKSAEARRTQCRQSLRQSSSYLRSR